MRRKKEKVREFREKYSHPCNIRFLGIFDTVKSVGYLRPKNLPHTRHNPIVQTVCHALSLHERRSFYAPTTWGGLYANTRPAVYVPACWGSGRYGPAIRWQDVREVWFAGDHSDVGGGYPRECSSPAHVSLRWTLEEARARGLMISHEAEAEVNELAMTITKGHLHDKLTKHETWKDGHGGFFGAVLTTARAETSKMSPRRLEKYGDVCRPGREISVPHFGEAGLPFTPPRRAAMSQKTTLGSV